MQQAMPLAQPSANQMNPIVTPSEHTPRCKSCGLGRWRGSVGMPKWLARRCKDWTGPGILYQSYGEVRVLAFDEFMKREERRLRGVKPREFVPDKLGAPSGVPGRWHLGTTVAPPSAYGAPEPTAAPKVCSARTAKRLRVATESLGVLDRLETADFDDLPSRHRSRMRPVLKKREPAQRLAQKRVPRPEKKKKKRGPKRRARPQNCHGVRGVELLASDPCAYCGDPASTTHDHIEPLYHGGAHTLDNLVRCCRRCNFEKARYSLLKFLVRRAYKRRGLQPPKVKVG